MKDFMVSSLNCWAFILLLCTGGFQIDLEIVKMSFNQKSILKWVNWAFQVKQHVIFVSTRLHY